MTPVLSVDDGLGKGVAVNVTPALIRKKYGINVEVRPDTKNIQAIASFLDQYYTPSDLSTFLKANNMSDTPVARVIGPNDPSNPGVEASLDIDFIMGISPVPTWIWSTAGNISGNEPFLDWLANVSSTTGPLPNIFSISYQDYEDTVSVDYMQRVNIEFAKMGVRGITLVTGSGDWGVGCNANGTRFRPDFPSSSPYIVSTGGTEFLDATTLEEGGITFSSGGFSDVFTQPSFQLKAISDFLAKSPVDKSFFNASGRAFPDVSAIAIGFQVYNGGKLISVGGTSASTPTFAAMLSLINEERLAHGRPTLGWVVPFLYAAAAADATAYTDIVKGNNAYEKCVGFDASQGWDPMTGLGTPNFPVLLKLAQATEFIPALAQFDERD
eukprot:Opistho-2@44547